VSAIGMTAIRTEEFTPPGPADFNLPPIGSDKTFEFLGQTMYLGVTKPMIQMVLAAVIVFAFLFYAGRKRAMVPGRLQYAGETGYGFVRNSLGRDIIGTHDFARFVPYLVALFFFILVNNLMAAVPFFQFPTFSRAGIAYALALISWLVYNGVGIQRHGFVGYFKHQTVPSGIKGPVLLLLVPLEFFSNILVRPVTLALRLFANMFAGHLLLILFALGGEYLLLHGEGLTKLAGPVAFLMFGLISLLELLVQVLQAYVFVLLTSMYISGAVAEEH
jgi:F-type H+-transporting ATPase subunit a